MVRKRVAFDARFINDRYHGIGRFAFQLLENLVSSAADFDFIIYRGRSPERRFNWDVIANQPNASIRSGPGPIYWPHEQLVWPVLLNHDKIDLFHSPYFLVPLLADTKVIMTVHDLIFERYPRYMPGVWFRPYYKSLINLGLKKSHKVIAVSQSTAKDLRNYYKIPLDKLAVIPEGVDESFSPNGSMERSEVIRKRYNLDAPYILTVGARRPHKNFERLIQAFARISKEHPHDLVLVGSPDPRFPDGVQGEIDRSGLNGRVRLMSWVPESDLPEIYKLAEFVVLPSILEGFGLPALESMACGTPVIAADNSSFPEVIGDAGILVDPFQVDQIEAAMRVLLTDVERHRQLSKAGLLRIREFSWNRTARMTADLYREILT